MEILGFALAVITISASGVMAPGPLFAANITYGLKQGTRSGIKIALGHTMVELPLIVLLGIGVFSLESFPEFRPTITILGAITLFVFAGIQIRTVLKQDEIIQQNQRNNPIIVGVAFSALNPFFIVWWITIGFKLISDAMMMWSFFGILILFALHIWMDFVWLGATAFLASKSSKLIKNKGYKILITGLSLMLIYFGITFLVQI